MMAQSILISGGGVAGLTLAYWLVRAGVKPVIVESSPQLRTGGYMIDFWGVGYTVAERMGLCADLHRLGYDIREIRLLDEVGHSEAVLSTDSLREALGGRYVSLLRGDLVWELYAALEDSAEIIFGDRVTKLRRCDHGVLAEFERQPARVFDAVVGADGIHSNVRELAFGAQTGFVRSLGYWAAAFTAEGYEHRDPGVYLSRTVPGRQVVRCTLRGTSSVFFIVLADEVMNNRLIGSPQDARGFLAEALSGMGWEVPAIIAALERSEDLYFDSVCQIHMPTWSTGPIVLLGDAAYCPSLLAGEGASFAMAGAYVLAGELAASGGEPERAFRAYERHLKAFMDRKQRSALRLGGWFAPRTRLGLVIRNQLTRLAGIPGASNLLLKPMVADRLSLPSYPWSIGLVT